MATKTITLHVSNNNKIDGVLRVTVDPWRVQLDKDDVVEWALLADGEGQPNNDIKWFRVERIEPIKPWPLAEEPPASRYIGKKGGDAVCDTRNDTAYRTGEVITYGLTIGFNDDAENLRIMYIDPDMVINS